MFSSNNCSIAELHEKAGQAVNSLVKYYYKSERERRLDVSPPPAAFTKLLYSLVVALESIFTHGLKPGGIFKYVILTGGVFLQNIGIEK